jgi:hypothetical protein
MWHAAVATSRSFPAQYARVARSRGVRFLDAGAGVATSEVDGIHWSAEGHAAFARLAAGALQ